MRPVRQGVAALTALAGAPVAAAALALRPAWRIGLSERLGRVDASGRAPLWVHAASAGEATAAIRLVAALRERNESIFLSTTTEVGRARLRESFPDEPIVLAPIDHPWCVDAALDGVAPRALLLLETELWPVWIAAAVRRGVPVAVVSARLSDRSFPRYLRARKLFAPTLRRLSCVCARSALDARRFVELGAFPDRVHVTGDLKLEPAPNAPALARDLVERFEGRTLLVAGSTHEGEELACIEAFRACRAEGLDLELVLAPRRLERVAALAKRLEELGVPFRRRSQLGGEGRAHAPVVLLDTMGELPGLYALATVAFVGGTLVPVGGHNLLEPLHADRPVIFGPHTQNVREAARLLLRSGAGTQVRDAAQLARDMPRLVRDAGKARVRVAAGKADLERHRGATERTLVHVDRLLRASEKPRVRAEVS